MQSGPRSLVQIEVMCKAIYLWTIYSVPLICISVITQLSHWIQVALVLEIWFGKYSSFCLHFQTSLPILNPLAFHINCNSSKKRRGTQNLIETEKI